MNRFLFFWLFGFSLGFRASAESQTLLSPILLCGPSGLAFKKPAVLSFQHCAALKHGPWSLSVYYSDSAPEDLPNWQVKTQKSQSQVKQTMLN